VLLTGSSAFGQFVVQPMKLVVPVSPGRRVTVELMVENVTRDTTQTVDMRLADITQDANGVWQAVEPGAQETKGPNGERLVDVGTDLSPNVVDISKLRSCQKWLRLVQKQVSIRPLNRVPVQVIIDVPAGTRGYYCAALLAQAVLGPQVVEGYMSNVVLEFVVPIIVEVQGRPERQNVELMDVGLEFRPQDERNEAATLVTLSINNSGGTYSMIKGYARIWGKLGTHWRKITDVEFPSDVSIIPGVQFRLKTNVGCALGAGEYKVQGYLFVDGKEGADIVKEMTFQGDPRVRSPAKGTGSLDLDPREVILDSQPGQTRSAQLLVVNASDDAVDVSVTTSLPDMMVDKASILTDVRGEQFDCTGWVEVSPTQFRLEGKQRINLKVISRMPADAASPNYYAMVRLHAKHADGEEAGKTDSRICIQNKKVPSNAMVSGLPMRVSELAPGRYAVAAQFSNVGSTHVQPTCMALLTPISNNSEVVKKLNLSNNLLSQSGLMLPLETRSFTGVIDVAGVAPGMYRLTAVMLHDKGAPIQYQTGLEVVATADGKTVKVDENLPGGKVPIKLQ
jgi:hypothetical protein